MVKTGSVKKIKLITGFDDEARMAEVQEKILELLQSLADVDVVLEVDFNTKIHDREIRIDYGWVIKIGRGLDFYQKPGGWFEIGATDLPCGSAWRPRSTSIATTLRRRERLD